MTASMKRAQRSLHSSITSIDLLNAAEMLKVADDLHVYRHNLSTSWLVSGIFMNLAQQSQQLLCSSGLLPSALRASCSLTFTPAQKRASLSLEIGLLVAKRTDAAASETMTVLHDIIRMIWWDICVQVIISCYSVSIYPHIDARQCVYDIWYIHIEYVVLRIDAFNWKTQLERDSMMWQLLWQGWTYILSRQVCRSISAYK